MSDMPFGAPVAVPIVNTSVGLVMHVRLVVCVEYFRSAAQVVSAPRAAGHRCWLTCHCVPARVQFESS